jgi:hypothetical protein
MLFSSALIFGVWGDAPGTKQNATNGYLRSSACEGIEFAFWQPKIVFLYLEKLFSLPQNQSSTNVDVNCLLVFVIFHPGQFV